MKVLLINGSPHANGCTYTALMEVAKTLNEEGIETEIVHIGNKDIRGCIACERCDDLKRCVFNDMVNEVLPKLEECDGLVLGSPVYYSSPNGTMISFLDRLFYCSNHINKAFKVGASVVCARRAGTTATFDVLNKYFTISNMPIVSSQYWNQVHGYTPDDVRKDLEGLQTMRTLGENMAWLLKSIEAGRAAGVAAPKYEAKMVTNFID